MLLLGPFLSPAKYACFYFLNTHFMIKVGVNGHASTTSSHITPTLLSHTSKLSSISLELLYKEKSASPQISFKKEKVIVFGETKFTC